MNEFVRNFYIQIVIVICITGVYIYQLIKRVRHVKWEDAPQGSRAREVFKKHEKKFTALLNILMIFPLLGLWAWVINNYGHFQMGNYEMMRFLQRAGSEGVTYESSSEYSGNIVFRSILISIGVIITASITGMIMKAMVIKEDAKEKSGSKSNIIKLPVILIWVFKGAAIIFAVFSIMFIFAYIIGRGEFSLIIFGVALSLITLLLSLLFKRWKIELKEDFMIITPMVGKEKRVSYMDVKKVEKKDTGKIIIYADDRKLVSIEPQVKGVNELMKKLKEHEITFVNV